MSSFPFRTKERRSDKDQGSRKTKKNSQHVLAAILVNDDHNNTNTNNNNNDHDNRTLLQSCRKRFDQTSELPCSYYQDTCSDTKSTVLMGANYPDCLSHSANFVGVLGGLAYECGSSSSSTTTNNNNKSVDDSHNLPLIEHVLTLAEDIVKQDDGEVEEFIDKIQNQVGAMIKQWSGYFSIYLLHKATHALLVWNDTFGFMPVFYQATATTLLFSSCWDCLVAVSSTVQLDWHVVAQYMIFGTTLDNRTFCRGIQNLEPGSMTMTRIKIPSGRGGNLDFRTCRYVSSYGACELLSENADADNDASTSPINEKTTGPSQHSQLRQRNNGSWYHAASGVQRVLDPVVQNEQFQKAHSQGPITSQDRRVMKRAHHYIRRALDQAHQQSVLTCAALTGGGDTRLVLASMSPDLRRQLRFQTHAKQITDWQIARYISNHMMQLNHHRLKTLSHRSTHSAMLHDRIPLRAQPKRSLFPTDLQRDQAKYRDIPTHTVHGRFGTEFMGFLCFDKSSLGISSLDQANVEEIETACKFLFRTSAETEQTNNEKDELTTMLVDPISALKTKWAQLGQDQRRLAEDCPGTAMFDVAYAFQLQLFSRAFLCDIYGGLRKGSWFAMPYSFFLRNNFSPFLDASLLRLLLCQVTVDQKRNPYEWYGDFYCECIPQEIQTVPCNNKLLCLHTGAMPLALKEPQRAEMEYAPQLTALKKIRCPGPTILEGLQKDVKERFHQRFWNGAILVAQADKLPSPKELSTDDRLAIRVLIDGLGEEKAILYASRLGNLLLWLEERFSFC